MSYIVLCCSYSWHSCNMGRHSQPLYDCSTTCQTWDSFGRYSWFPSLSWIFMLWVKTASVWTSVWLCEAWRFASGQVRSNKRRKQYCIVNYFYETCVIHLCTFIGILVWCLEIDEGSVRRRKTFQNQVSDKYFGHHDKPGQYCLISGAWECLALSMPHVNGECDVDLDRLYFWTLKNSHRFLNNTDISGTSEWNLVISNT
jgi:hypothetical protein